MGLFLPYGWKRLVPSRLFPLCACDVDVLEAWTERKRCVNLIYFFVLLSHSIIMYHSITVSQYNNVSQYNSMYHSIIMLGLYCLRFYNLFLLFSACYSYILGQLLAMMNIDLKAILLVTVTFITTDGFISPFSQHISVFIGCKPSCPITNETKFN